MEIRLLNDGADPAVIDLPARLDGFISVGGRRQAVTLSLLPAGAAQLTVPAGGFSRASYALALPDDLPAGTDIVLTVDKWRTPGISFTSAAPTAPVLAAGAPAPAHDNEKAMPPPADRAAGNAFLDNLSAYEPIYAVYGPGTNSEARIQLSFKYQLFGSRARQNGRASLLDGVYFAYTQRMLWDLGTDSSPFRNIDFQPEIFYHSPSLDLSGDITASVQAGIQHESNGRDGDASRSANNLYISPVAAIPLGGEYRLTVSPRAWVYIGDLSENPDLRRYRGNMGLFAEVGKDDGLRLSTFTRFNFSSGKGSFAADLSYPLKRIIGGAPDFYLFGQSFVGYGENLLDYDVRVTRFRIGIALVR